MIFKPMNKAAFDERLALWLKFLLIVLMLIVTTGCANITVYSPTFHSPVHVTGAGGVTNFPGDKHARQQADAKNAIALNNATTEIALLGAEDAGATTGPTTPGCPVFVRPDYVPVPGIPLREINAIGEEETNRKLELIITYTQNLRQWIIARRQIQDEAYAKYQADCRAILAERDKDAKRR